MTGIGIRLVDVPTAAAGDPRARTYIIDHLSPGASIKRRIEVTNGTASTARVAVYPGAASVTRAGFVGAEGRTPNELATWTTATPHTLVLAPGRRAPVTVRVTVPSRAVSGEDYAVVWAQITTPPKSPGGITQVSRVGIRLYLSIGPGGAPPSDFSVVSLTAARDASNVPIVQASVRNTGQRALDLSGTLKLFRGPGGLAAGPFPIPVATTLGIGQTQALRVKLNTQLPNGPWQAKITLVSGITTRTAQATLTFPSGPGVSRAAPGHIATQRPLPLLGAALAALLLLIAYARHVLDRRKRHQKHLVAGQRPLTPTREPLTRTKVRP